MILQLQDNGNTIDIHLLNIPRGYRHQFLELYDSLLRTHTTDDPEEDIIDTIIRRAEDEIEEEKQQGEQDDVQGPVILVVDDINFNELTDRFNNPLKENTIQDYQHKTKTICSHFHNNDINDILTNYFDDLVKFIAEIDGGDKLKDSYINPLINICRHFQYDNHIIKLRELHQQYRKQIDDKQTNKKEMTSDETQQHLDNIQKVYDSVRNIVYETDETFTYHQGTYSMEFKTLLFCKFFFDYGTLRNGEYRQIKITDSDECGEMNYINLQTKQLIVREHKNKKYKEIRTIDLKDDFTELIKNRVGKYLFTNTKDEVYSDNDKLNKNTVKKWFSLTFTQLRHIKTSSMINQEYETNIANLEEIQGHNKQTMLKYYTKSI